MSLCGATGDGDARRPNISLLAMVVVVIVETSTVVIESILRLFLEGIADFIEEAVSYRKATLNALLTRIIIDSTTSSTDMAITR